MNRRIQDRSKGREVAELEWEHQMEESSRRWRINIGTTRNRIGDSRSWAFTKA